MMSCFTERNAGCGATKWPFFSVNALNGPSDLTSLCSGSVSTCAILREQALCEACRSFSDKTCSESSLYSQNWGTGACSDATLRIKIDVMVVEIGSIVSYRYEEKQISHLWLFGGLL